MYRIMLSKQEKGANHHVDVPSLAVVADARDFGLIDVQVLEKLVQPGFN